MTDSMLEYYGTSELPTVNWRKVCELKTRNTFAEMLKLFKARMSFPGLGIGIDILKTNAPLDMMIGHDLKTVDNIYLGKWGVVYVSEYIPIVRYSPPRRWPPTWKKIRYTKKPDGMIIKEEAYSYHHYVDLDHITDEWQYDSYIFVEMMEEEKMKAEILYHLKRTPKHWWRIEGCTTISRVRVKFPTRYIPGEISEMTTNPDYEKPLKD